MLLPRLQSFQARMPDTDIRLTTQPSLMKAHPAEADLTVLLGKDEWPDLVTHRLFPRRLVVACAPSLLSHLDPRSFSSLDGQALIVHENRPQSWENWARALDVPAPRAGKVIRFDSMSSLVQAAAQGLGVALVSWPVGRRWFDSGALVRVFDSVVETGEYFCLAYRPGEHERMDIAPLIDWILDEFGTDEKT